MNIRILHLVEGAKEARGVTVVIDVFSAFTVEAYLMAQGAKELIPVGDMQIAYDLKKADPSCLLVGERHGRILPGFDFGNSPSQIRGASLRGKTVVHTTSAGTQGVANAKNASEILTGSLVNARATAEYILRKDPAEVSLVCMGLEAKAQTEEDDLCAEYIRGILTGEEIAPEDMRSRIENLKTTSGAKFFDPAQKDVFPEPDFYLSTEIDVFPFALRAEKGADGMDRIRMLRAPFDRA